MNPFRTQVKFFFRNPERVKVERFGEVFQRWIQQKALEDMLIDVADYRHVFEGPGIVLIGDDADYAIENRDGRLGLLYTRKRQASADLQTQLRTSLQRALAACQLLESETAFLPRLKFLVDAIELRFPDRLQLPNTPESFDLIHEGLKAVLSGVYGDSVQLARVEGDPRALFTVSVHGEGVVRVSDMLQNFQTRAEQ